METTTKKMTLRIAETIDGFRVFPRLLLAAYAYLVYDVIQWFMGLTTPNTQQSALVTTVTAMSAVVIGLYQNSGRKWGKTPAED